MACDVQTNETKVEPVWLTLLVKQRPPHDHDLVAQSFAGTLSYGK